MLPKLVVIVGPTAVGKTSMAIELAKQFDGEVVSADSRQVYRGMDIGTAKPEGEWIEQEIERGSITQLFGSRRCLLVDGVPHWGIDLADPDQEFNVAQFKAYAEERITDITSRGKLPILVGGTGLWVRAVVDNLTLTETPPNPELRVQLEARHLDDLFAEYKRLDPEGAETIDRDNKRRVVRALEVTLTTGKPFSHALSLGEPKYDVLQIGVDLARDQLYERINDRVDVMIANGLVDEVRVLHKMYGSETTAMSGIGYRQICRFLEGKVSLADAIEQIKRDSRNYAKRQLTWFNRDKRIRWVAGPAQAIMFVQLFKNAS